MQPSNSDVYDFNRDLFLKKMYQHNFVSSADRQELKLLKEQNQQLLAERDQLQQMFQTFQEQFNNDSHLVQEYAVYKSEIDKNEKLIAELKQQLSHAHDQQIFYQNKVDRYIRRANGL